MCCFSNATVSYTLYKSAAAKMYSGRFSVCIDVCRSIMRNFCCTKSGKSSYTYVANCSYGWSLTKRKYNVSTPAPKLIIWMGDEWDEAAKVNTQCSIALVRNHVPRFIRGLLTIVKSVTKKLTNGSSRYFFFTQCTLREQASYAVRCNAIVLTVFQFASVDVCYK